MKEKNIDKKINYDIIKKMEEHSKKYEESSDKKEFLKNICAYEQKLILLNSKKPYEVLNYLDQLDIKSSRLILEELSFDEVKQILELFTAEDKKDFYTTFSDLSLVNQFIIHDKSSLEYIKELSFERKVDLIDSSNKKTVMASAKIYETIPKEQRSTVSEAISTSDSISALSEASVYVESTEVGNEVIDENHYEINDAELENLNEVELQEETENELNEEIAEKVNGPELNKDEKVEENLENKKMIEKINTEEIIEEINSKEIIEDSEKDIEYYEKYSIVGNGESIASIISNINAVENFEKIKQETEQKEIEQILNKKTEFNYEEENIKMI